MVTGLMTKAEKSPQGFLESYEEMLSYALRPETWATTRLELEGRGVSLLMLSSWGSSELRSFVGSLFPVQHQC